MSTSPFSFLPGRSRLDRVGQRLSAVTPMRAVAVGCGLLLVGSFLRVFYRVTDVVGGTRWLAASVGGAFLLATALALRVPVRRGLRYGLALAAAGVVAYVVAVPELRGFVFSVGFVVRWLAYLSGITVLQYLRVDLWAILVAPGPVLLSWYPLLRRRYDLAAVVGGLMLGFFAMTGDAGAMTTLTGVVGLLGTVGVGTIEREGGSWRQVEQFGLLVVVGVLAARLLQVVPDGGSDGGTGGGDGGGGGGGSPPVQGDLDNADARARVFESISLSPRVQFTIEADDPAYWHAGAYDRYTGDDWIRTGPSEPYESGLDPPDGMTSPVLQTVRAETEVATMPAAWKPVELDGWESVGVEVTALGGLVPRRSFEAGDEYRVVSQVPADDPEVLRRAGDASPGAIGERFLQLPSSTPSRIGRRAREVAGAAETPYDAAIAIRDWLRREKAYSLSVDPPGGDLVDGFLFSMDAGYCVYFASAMTVMLRTLGVPARYALGYTTGQSVADDRWVVRGLNSHAWVEVYFPGVGWVTFDPTPPRPRRRAERETLERAREEDLSGIDTAASRRDTPTPTPTPTPIPETVAAAGPVSTPVPSGGGLAVGGPVDASTPTPANPGPVSSLVDAVTGFVSERDRVAMVAGATGVVLGLHWSGVAGLGYRAIQLRWQRPTESPRRDVERAFERLERLLAGSYRPRRSGETPRQYIASVGAGRLDRRARRVAELHERARYAGRVSREEADEAIRLVDDLVREEAPLARLRR